MNNMSSEYDAILIPGGGLKSSNELPLWIQHRFDLVLKLYTGETVIPLSGGTVHKPPPLDSTGRPVVESVVGAAYLIANGIDPRKIICETTSYDTIGNAFFSRVIHVDPAGFRRLLIVTSASHLPRTKAIFQWVYGLKSPVGHNDYTLHFKDSPDLGLEKESLEARIQKEQEGLVNILRLRERIRTFEELHRWLFTEHGAYSVSVVPRRMDGHILNSY